MSLAKENVVAVQNQKSNSIGSFFQQVIMPWYVVGQLQNTEAGR